MIINSHRFGGGGVVLPASLAQWIAPWDSATLFDARIGGSTPAGEAEIKRIEDKSGFGRHAVIESGVGVGAIRKVAAANGQDVARFGGTSYYDVANYISGFTQATAIYTFKPDLDPPVNSLLSADPMPYWGTDGNGSHTPFTDGVVYNQWGSTTRTTVGNLTPNWSTAYRVVTITTAANDWRFYVDGVLQFSTASNTVAFRATKQQIGSALWATNTYYMVGNLAEILVFDEALDTGVFGPIVTDRINKFNP